MPCGKKAAIPHGLDGQCKSSSSSLRLELETSAMPGIPATFPPTTAVTATTETTATAGLLTSTSCRGHVHLIVGSNAIAATRAQRSLEAGARVRLVAAPEGQDGDQIHYGLRRRIEDGEVDWVCRRQFEDRDLETLGREEVGGVVDLVWVTMQAKDVASRISALCKRLRIPVNCVDSAVHSTFSLLATHTAGPLHIGVTTSGNGCKLASRIRREIAAALPPDIGEACIKIGALRRRLIDEAGDVILDGICGDEEAGDQSAAFNTLITPADEAAAKTRRIRWLSQICEYWPLDRLGELSEADLADVPTSLSPSPPFPSVAEKKAGKILLVGSGPGHPELLTIASRDAIQNADLILADKLVPAAVLELIPRRTPVFIAKKYPGNAEAAQEELLARGLAAAKAGQTVVRLKQGDPYIYGRGGEEVSFFAAAGFPPTVLPGITSALSAPLFAGIPATHRGVSDQVLICTGTGRRGAPPDPPEWVPTRTTVFLMALHRVDALVAELAGKGWPRDTPCAVVERASCADQRVVRTTLGVVGRAIEEMGSRPPGLLVVGHACGVLTADVAGAKGWVVEEGISGGWKLT